MENEEKKVETSLNKALEKPVAEKEIEVGDAIEKEIPFDFEAHLQEKDNEELLGAAPVEDDDDKPKKKAKKVSEEKIKILDSSGLDRENDLRNALFGKKAAFQVVCAQSAYQAKIAPLVHKDVISLLYSNLSRYEYRKAVFKVIYDKILAISSEKMTFEEWLKATSVEDIETLYYGVYCSTFPNEGTFTFSCPECGEESSMRINHSNLFKTTDRKKMKELINKVSKQSISKEARLSLTLVGKTEMFQLTDSGIVMEVRTPSLWDSLEILRLVPERVIDRDTTSVTNMLYIKRFLIPAKDRDGYTVQTDSQELLRIIDNLTIDDAAELQEVISDKVDQSRITYSIKNIECPHCHTKISDTPISIEDILFTLIFEKAQG